ncbi:hypothetical protein ACEPAI_3643 [Sanghuangporus weigelae]
MAGIEEYERVIALYAEYYERADEKTREEAHQFADVVIRCKRGLADEPELVVDVDDLDRRLKSLAERTEFDMCVDNGWVSEIYGISSGCSDKSDSSCPPLNEDSFECFYEADEYDPGTLPTISEEEHQDSVCDTEFLDKVAFDNVETSMYGSSQSQSELLSGGPSTIPLIGEAPTKNSAFIRDEDSEQTCSNQASTTSSSELPDSASDGGPFPCKWRLRFGGSCTFTLGTKQSHDRHVITHLFEDDGYKLRRFECAKWWPVELFLTSECRVPSAEAPPSVSHTWERRFLELIKNYPSLINEPFKDSCAQDGKVASPSVSEPPPAKRRRTA